MISDETDKVLVPYSRSFQYEGSSSELVTNYPETHLYGFEGVGNHSIETPYIRCDLEFQRVILIRGCYHRLSCYVGNDRWEERQKK